MFLTQTLLEILKFYSFLLKSV